jgi:hypothetical protein
MGNDAEIAGVIGELPKCCAELADIWICLSTVLHIWPVMHIAVTANHSAALLSVWYN